MNLFQRIKAKVRPRAVLPCVPPKGTLVVVLTRSDTGKPVQGAPVTVSGPTKGAGNTDDLGAVIFNDRTPGAYKANVTLPMALNHLRWQQQSPDGSVSADAVEMLLFKVAPPPTLKVKVIWQRLSRGQATEHVLDGVRIKATGAQDCAAPTGKDGMVTFPDINEGSYHVTVESLGPHADKYTVPDPASISLALAESKQLTLIAVPLVSLRIVLFDKRNQPISGKAWTIDSPIPARGTTGGDGLIEVKKIPWEWANGKLTVAYGRPPPAAAKAAPVKPLPVRPDAPPPYPPHIDPDEFPQGPYLAASPLPPSIEWSLSIELLDDFRDDTGTKWRLHNLGFVCNGDSVDPETTRAVRAYQRHHMNQPQGSGVLADAQGHIVGRHDNP